MTDLLAASTLTLYHSISPATSLTYLTPTVLQTSPTHLLNAHLPLPLLPLPITASVINPQKTHVAVSQGSDILILAIPDFSVYKRLHGAAKVYVNAMAFDASGEKLATVAGDPDYMLTIWEWKKQEPTLRAKAFSQDVTTVAYHPTLNTQLITAGVGHIKFWKISNSFTGLKLQGALGKFGGSELTDINAVVQLQDGRTISSTEYGNLLLWQGGFIKSEITVATRTAIHAGGIRVVQMNQGNLLTAGNDGYIRTWSLKSIDDADAEEIEEKSAVGQETRKIVIEPLEECLVGKEVKIRAVAKVPESETSYTVLNAAGSLLTIDLSTKEKEVISTFHTGAVNSIDTSPKHEVAVSGGEDGSIRLYNIASKTIIGSTNGNNPVTVVYYLPENVDCLGQSFAAGYKDGTIRIFVHRNIIATDGPLLRLRYVFKPHSQNINTISIDTSGSYMATTSLDGNVFFFELSVSEEQLQEVKPLGFVNFASVVTCIDFYPNKSGAKNATKALLTFRDGSLSTINVPTSRSFSNSASYQIDRATLGLSPIKLNFQEELKQAQGMLASHMASVEEAKLRSKMDQENEENTSPNIPSEDEKPAPTIDDPIVNVYKQRIQRYSQNAAMGGPYQAMSTHYLSQGQFLLSLSGPDGGEIRMCNIDNPDQSRMLHAHTSTFTSMRLSRSGKYLIMGTRNGTIMMRPLSWNQTSLENWSMGHEIPHTSGQSGGKNVDDMAVETSTDHWEGYLHTESRAQVSACVTSWSDVYYVSAGTDGAIYFLRMNSEDVKPSEARDVAPVTFESPADVTDAAAFTLQDSKLKAEHVKQLQELEVRKSRIRQELGEMRQAFEHIVSNAGSDPEWSIDARRSLPINEATALYVQQQTHAAMEQARKELEWEKEKESIGRRKLQNHFMQNVCTDTITINSFFGANSISTFKTHHPPMPKDLQSKTNMKNFREKASLVSKAARALHATAADGKRARPAAKTNGNKSKQEARKLQRQERALQMKKLLEQKPDEHFEDPKEVAAIQFAQANMGEYRLKSGPRYLAPEQLRWNVARKESQADKLIASLFTVKEQFNAMALSLRKKKEEIVSFANTHVGAIDAARKSLTELGIPSAPLATMVFEESAFPEKAFEPSADDITQHRLELQAIAAPVQSENAFSAVQPVEVVSKAVVRPKIAPYREVQPIDPDDETQVQLASQYNNVYKQLDEMMRSFDAKIDTLCRERVLLLGDVTFGEMQLLVMRKEMSLLKHFEAHDRALTEKLYQKQAEKAESDTKVQDSQTRLNDCKDEVAELMVRQQEVTADFMKTIGEDNRHEDALTNIFRKRIKRPKKRKTRVRAEGAPGVDNEDASVSSDSDMSLDLSDLSSDNEVEEDVMPTECDPALYQAVLALREQRLDQEEALVDVTKKMEVLKKDMEALMKKERVLDAALRSTEEEIEETQIQKQRRLNEVDIMVPLKLSQIHTGPDIKLSGDLTPALLFMKEGIAKLRERIKELQEEKANIRKQHHELKKQHVTLNKGKTEKQAKLAELEKRAVDVQMLKFGRTVDLETLERVGTNRIADELREKLDVIQSRQIMDLAKLDVQIAQLRDRNVEMTVENTHKLESIAKHKLSHRAIEASLASAQRVSTADMAPKIQDQMERERLGELVRFQAHEIEMLRNEIVSLNRHSPNKMVIHAERLGAHNSTAET